LAEILVLFRTPGPRRAQWQLVPVTGLIRGGWVPSRKAPPVWDVLPGRPDSVFIAPAHLARMGRRLAWSGAGGRIVPLIHRFRVDWYLRRYSPMSGRQFPAHPAATDFVVPPYLVICPHAPVTGPRMPVTRGPVAPAGAFRAPAPVSAVTPGLNIGKRCQCAPPVKVPVDAFPSQVRSAESPDAPIPVQCVFGGPGQRRGP
jgi:hypothetical protein